MCIDIQTHTDTYIYISISEHMYMMHWAFVGQGLLPASLYNLERKLRQANRDIRHQYPVFMQSSSEYHG